MNSMTLSWVSLWYINTVVVLQMSPDPIGYSLLCNWQYPECSKQEVDFHIQMKKSLGRNVVRAWWHSSSWLKQVLGICTVHALRILSSARESEVQVGDETKTQEGMSGEGQGQRGRKALNVRWRIWNCPLWARKLVDAVLSPQKCSSFTNRCDPLWPIIVLIREHQDQEDEVFTLFKTLF